MLLLETRVRRSHRACPVAGEGFDELIIDFLLLSVIYILLHPDPRPSAFLDTLGLEHLHSRGGRRPRAFSGILSNLLSILGYWTAPFVEIVAEEVRLS
ncbi:hypothetical protein BV22DRAFT_302083 [Leucogyrophana mollusca]|uniref:Uncharacterized protein n=1 Tax=Leucogyrophana mollusca TaxID=85980 RepID=A0ACB8BNP9_9AGAM|nr:hypothetical protein BV22DRAFT_302083 [Leucogyrophana mollusca]